MKRLLTVLMTVYNGEEYIRETIDSVLKQTYGEFEFLVIDNKSTDRTIDIVKSYSDKRIRLKINDRNLGQTGALNVGLRMIKTKYVARIDADDVCLPTRFEKQIKYLESHPKVGVCGTWIKTVGNPEGIVFQHPTVHRGIAANMLFENPLAHPSVMLRTEMFKKNKLFYSAKIKYYQDYHLWARALDHMLMANLDDILVLYRIHENQASQDSKNEERLKDNFTTWRFLLGKIGIEPTDEDLEVHSFISTRSYKKSVKFRKSAFSWMDKLLEANNMKKYFPQRELQEYVDKRKAEILGKPVPNASIFDRVIRSVNVFR